MSSSAAERAGTVRAWSLLLPLFALIVLISGMPRSAPLFHWLFPDLDRPVYSRASFLTLTVDHLLLVVGASIPVVIVGVGAGIFVTRPSGREFSGIVDSITAVGQTFPPAAVLALAVPVVGYGATPALVALFAYGILPVVDNTIAGLRAIPSATLDAATGMGFGAAQRLWRVELPLAAPVIVAGIRTSVAVAIGTATIGSTVGALTLGSPIIEGLSGSNTAYVVQGAIVVAALAIFVDRAFAALDARLRQWTGDQPAL
jgi:osmoprotectant transport system permease protein